MYIRNSTQLLNIDVDAINLLRSKNEEKKED